ncbi:MAG: sugar ABC transporter substrate-binding protein [Betaproteobacteria bacterium]|nr:sugar ABC transporter substrate-binding protein [Betaproteobacteria bacterium]
MASGREPLIAVFTKNRTNPAYTAARLGAERTAARLGAHVVHYVPETPDDIDEQIALVDRALAARPDAVVFVPVHATAMNASVRRLNAAGVPLVNILNRLAEGERVCFVGSDDYRLGRNIAEYLFRHIGGKGDVVIIEGMQGAVTSRDRTRGFLDAAKDASGIRIAATRAGDYQTETAKRAMAELLAQLPRIDGVLAANDSMALGIMEALAAGARRVPVVGVNAIPEAITAIKRGTLLATADFDALKIGCIATEAAVRHLRGQPVPPEIELPVQIVDASNYAPWDKPLEERSCPSWENVVTTGKTEG